MKMPVLRSNSQGNALDADKIVVINTVNTDLPGEYIVSYDYAIEGASAVTIIRTVTVVDQTAPVFFGRRRPDYSSTR